MTERLFVLSIIFIFPVIHYAKAFEVINETILHQEKVLYIELLDKAKNHLEFLVDIEETNQYATQYSTLGNDNAESNQTSILNVIPLSSNPQKQISHLFSITNLENEKIFYHIIDLSKSNLGKVISSNKTLSSKTNKQIDKDNNINRKDYLLLIKVTSRSISVTRQDGATIASLSFSFNIIDLIKVDFSTFDEDNTLLFLTSTNEVLVLRTNIHLKGSTYDALKASILIPTRKSFGINIKQDDPVVTFTQHKLHGNKYIVIAYQNGEIFVLNKNLEMKSAISINSFLSKLYLFNGIIFAINGNKIVFINLLGGNTILLSCSNYYDIIDVYFDPGDNLLFYIDSGNRLVVMNTKLTIAKANENECSTIYNFHLPSFASINRSSRLISSKSELFILTSDYIGHINLNQLSSKGLSIDHYAIYKMSNFGLNNNNDKISSKSQYEIFHTNVMGMFYLLHNSNYVFKIEKARNQINLAPPLRINGDDNSGTFKESQTVDQITKSNSNGRVECNGNMICLLLFNTATNNKNTVFYLYGIVIIILSAIVIFYQRSRAKEEMKKKEYEEDKKKTNNVTNEKLQEMLEEIKKIEKYQHMNPLEQNKGQGEVGDDDHRTDSDDIDEEIEEEDFKGHSN